MSSITKEQQERKERLAKLKAKRASGKVTKPTIKSRNFNFETKLPISSFDKLIQKKNEDDLAESETATGSSSVTVGGSKDIESKTQTIRNELLTKFEKMADDLSKTSKSSDKNGFDYLKQMADLENDQDERIVEYDEFLNSRYGDVLKRETELSLVKMVNGKLRSLVKE
ncbi:unnamed protein product [Ambrosiozyma monospora]|uniref:Unnamed protein product n=1 Tax=Ambrosiozyma monospora TaxID=43982 RepID=A0ACB5T241_AMBMO|nr:unnamed protein product [Ambrosiozyma monospora]